MPPDTMRYFCTTEQIALYLQKYIVYTSASFTYGLTGRLEDAQLMRAIRKTATRSFSSRFSDVQVRGHSDSRQSEDQNYACRDVAVL